MTIMLAMTALFAGAVLGLRFKVFVLVPAIAIGSAAALGIELAYGNTFWAIVAAMALTLIGLQMGFLGGTVLRAAARARGGKAALRAMRPVPGSHRKRAQAIESIP